MSDAAAQALPGDGPRINAYRCDTCHHYFVTEDLDPGTTPMFLACRVLGYPSDPKNTCDGTAESMGYPEQPWPAVDQDGTPIPTKPTWDFYRPGADEIQRLDRATFDHLVKGGLLLRRRVKPPPPPPRKAHRARRRAKEARR